MPSLPTWKHGISFTGVHSFQDCRDIGVNEIGVKDSVDVLDISGGVSLEAVKDYLPKWHFSLAFPWHGDLLDGEALALLPFPNFFWCLGSVSSSNASIAVRFLSFRLELWMSVASSWSSLYPPSRVCVVVQHDVCVLLYLQLMIGS